MIDKNSGREGSSGEPEPTEITDLTHQPKEVQTTAGISAEEVLFEVTSTDLEEDLTSSQMLDLVKAKFPPGLADLLGQELINLIMKNRTSLKAVSGLPEAIKPGIISHVKDEIRVFFIAKQEVLRVYLEVVTNPGQFVETAAKILEAQGGEGIPDSALRQIGLSYEKMGEIIAQRLLKSTADEVVKYLKTIVKYEDWVQVNREGVKYVISFRMDNRQAYTEWGGMKKLQEFLSKFPNVSTEISYRDVAGTSTSVYGEELVIIEIK